MFHAKTHAPTAPDAVKTVERPFYPLLFSPQKIDLEGEEEHHVRRRVAFDAFDGSLVLLSRPSQHHHRGCLLRARSGSFASSSSLSSPPATQFAVKNERAIRHALRAQNDDENDENTSSLSTSLAKSLAEELCLLSVGAADASNGSFCERKKALKRRLLIASLLEEAEAEVNTRRRRGKTSTMTVKTTKAEIERELQ